MSKPWLPRLLLLTMALAPSAAFGADRSATHLVPSWSQSTAEVAAGDSATAHFTVLNNGPEPLYLLDREWPFAGLRADLFDVRRDGRPVEYIGPLHRFTPPSAADYRRLEPGGRLSVTVDLEGAYDFSRPGAYSVRFRGLATAFRKNAESGLEALGLTRRGAILHLAVQRDERAVEAAAAPQLEATTARSIVPIMVGCSATRMSQILQAMPLAETMARKGLQALSFFSPATPNYTTWFGTWSFNNAYGAWLDFANIENTLQNVTYTLRCDCNQAGTFAYTYKSTPGDIHLCPAFWAAPLNGFSSKADTLVHETSHWPTYGADADDYAYGTIACQNLALISPWLALDNADNFAFFAASQP